MEVTKSIKNIFIDFDEHHSIESNFKNTFDSGYVALHPFYKSVFQEDYDYRRCLKDTFHLIQPVSWDKVIAELKFKNINQLAKALLNLNSSEFRELKDFLEYKRVLIPVIEEDTIPEILLNKYLKSLIIRGVNEVIRGYSKHTIFEDDKQNTKIQVNERNIFEVIGQLQNRFVVTENNMEIVLLLPGHDSAYTLILGDNEVVKSFITDFEIEGFWVDKKTTFNWWAD